MSDNPRSRVSRKEKPEHVFDSTMTSFEEPFAMINTCPDERAAGVISGSDPYRELELYLEKVNDEIGEVFDKWSTLGKQSLHQQPIKSRKRLPSLQQYSTWQRSDDSDDKSTVAEGHLKFFRSYSLPNRRPTSSSSSASLSSTTSSNPHSFETYLDAWSENLLAEFDTIIEREAAATTDLSSGDSKAAIRSDAFDADKDDEDDDYDEVAGDSSEDDSNVYDVGELEDSAKVAEMKYRIGGYKRDELDLVSSSPTVSDRSSGSGNSSRRLGSGAYLPTTALRTPPQLAQMVRSKQRSHVASVSNKHDPVLVNVKHYSANEQVVSSPTIPTTDSDNVVSNHPTYPAFDCCTNKTNTRRCSAPLVAETGTQTSPAESRSSSFTWISDCSEDDHSSSTASSTEDSRRLGESSGDSTPVKEEPESGIGTASPPRHNKYNKSSGSVLKYRRKEVWDRLRRRQSGRANSSRTESPASRAMDVRLGDYSNVFSPIESSSDPDLTVFRPQRPTCLPLASSLSPESSRETLPSPSALSLKLPVEPAELAGRELHGKSSSAPLLMKQNNVSSACGSVNKKVSKQFRFHSEKLLIEIEAAEACKWLRAAGFPQYAQMYEDKQFPIDINSVQKDHKFLEPDTLQSLFRRFNTLNRCANMKVELMPANKDDDSDSDAECALSEYWSFQRESRRWSRNRDVLQETPPGSGYLTNDDSCDNIAVVLRNNTLPPFSISTPESDLTVSRFRRSGSERLRDGAKAFLRRVESLKSRRRKQKNREGVVISGPLIVDASSMEARIKDLNCVDVTPPESPVTLEESRSSRRYLSKPEPDFSAFSDSEVSLRQSFGVNGRSNKTNVLLDICDVSTKPSRCSSRSDSQDSQTFSQLSPVIKNDENSEVLFVSETDASMRPKISVVRWHSFQRNSARPNSLRGQSINALTVGQIRVLRKLAMLKLTAIMEKYCPTHRTTGWNWELPKFIRKAKTPDYKDKSVFGVPLLTNAQQSGFVLPEYILEALNWLRANALDQVGIFRKPGVRSRIHKLKMSAELKPPKINFDGQQAYDVADMVKQYFRELPDALLTNKLSETFVAIFQYVPDSLRAEGVQRALILLPDEHRDALLVLLGFLHEVAQHSYVNQMSASNLALCLAPSLFYWTHASTNYPLRRSSSMSPKRLQKSGTFPDVKELGQNKAAHECLYYLIKHYRDLFTISEDTMAQCHFDYMDESVPVSLNELGEELQQDWRGYMNMCRNALLKEVKEKNRGWVISSVFEDVEIAYKKVRDGHPLRLWRVCVEVEAPPKDILYRILYERDMWDPMLHGSKIVQRLDQNTELFQYVTRGIGPLPQKDFCVIRSWKTDLSKDGCMVVETSVEHEDAEVIPGCVRGIVLASRYLIEPCGSGKSRILHLSRVDIKGRSSEWYNKCYGHACARHLIRLRHSFQRMTEGPESKV